MTAIITDKIKKLLAQSLYDELDGTNIGDSDNYYYVAISRSQQWQPDDNTDISPTPVENQREERRFRYSMQSLKSVEAHSFVVPLYDWSSNTVYSAYSDNAIGQPAQSFYVRTDDNNVYLCVKSGKSSTGTIQVSTVKPDHTDATLPIETDGYVWKYLYTISTADANSFLTANFMPVKYVDSAAATDPYFGQYTIQNAGIPGQIVGYRVVDQGGVYTSAPSITITGNGTGAKGRAILNTSGGIQAVEVGDSANAPVLSNMGSGYTYANVTVGSGTLSGGGNPATVVPIFGPNNGLGSDPRDDLRSTSIMLNVKPDGTVNNKWVTGNDYRQIGVLRNPTEYNSNTKFTSSEATAVKKLTITTAPGNINYSNDVKMTGSLSTAQAWVDFYDDSSTFWYHQDENTGFKQFQSGEALVVDDYTATALTVDSAAVDPDIDIFSGDLLYIDNRATPTARDAGQTEDIKVVIKL